MVARAAFLLATIAATSTATAASRACTAVARFSEERVYVGQQVVYRVETQLGAEAERIVWKVEPHFPGLRRVWLPDRSTGRSRTRRHALFALRPGNYQATGAVISCRDVQGHEAGRVEIQELAFEAKALPPAGRPPEFTGIVGALSLRAWLDPNTLPIGEAARLHLVVRSDGELAGMALPSAALESVADLDVFLASDEASEVRGERLESVRRVAWDLVPRRTGRIDLPPLRFHVFDPKTRRYKALSTSALSLETVARATEPDH